MAGFQMSTEARLRDLTEAPFVWFPRSPSPAFYDRMMHECFRGGLKSPRVVFFGIYRVPLLPVSLFDCAENPGQVSLIPGCPPSYTLIRIGKRYRSGQLDEPNTTTTISVTANVDLPANRD
jgi:hypothetical protein